MRVIPDGSVFDLYGRWNAIIGLTEGGDALGILRAHDGDFFPESVMDYVEALREQSEGRDFGESHFRSPLRVDIDITQACNAQCRFCFSRPYQQAGYRGQFASSALLKSIISELGRSGSKTIRFCGGGDPLVHPEIYSILPLVHRAGMRLCVISNLDFIDAKLSAMLSEHVDHIRWSVNAATDETRIEIHRPGRSANPLHVSMDWVEKIAQKREGHCPMIWATFLVLPSNFHEMPEAARLLRETGVDSVSFRPVFHGLGGSWKDEQLAALPELFDETGTFDDRPRFSVFVPRRDMTQSAALDPRLFFPYCHSRNMRTVLEATSAGLTLQSCGMYRGSGSTNRRSITPSNDFQSVWRIQSYPEEAPGMCGRCIDVSMNVTLRAIEAILEHDRTAKFYRVHLNDDELGDLKAGALLAVEGELPNWVQDWMLEVEPGTKTAVSVA